MVDKSNLFNHRNDKLQTFYGNSFWFNNMYEVKSTYKNQTRWIDGFEVIVGISYLPSLCRYSFVSVYMLHSNVSRRIDSIG